MADGGEILDRHDRVLRLLSEGLARRGDGLGMSELLSEIEAGRWTLWIGEGARTLAVMAGSQTGMDVIVAAGEEPGVRRWQPAAEAYARGRTVFAGPHPPWREPLLQRLQEGLAHCGGTHTLSDVLQSAAAGDTALWVTADASAVLVSEIIAYPQSRAMNIFLGAGDRRQIARCIPGGEAYARGRGCAAMMFSGRAPKGTAWSRMFRSFEPRWVLHTKELK